MAVSSAGVVRAAPERVVLVAAFEVVVDAEVRIEQASKCGAGVLTRLGEVQKVQLYTGLID